MKDFALSVRAPPFTWRVWELCSKIPAGQVTTYQELAHALGCKAYRAIGNALHKNTQSPDVPCHRVVRSNAMLGGFARGSAEKEKLLRAEGIEIVDGRIADFEKRLFRFSFSAFHLSQSS